MSLYRKVMDLIDDYMFIIKEDGTIDYMNKTSKDFFKIKDNKKYHYKDLFGGLLPSRKLNSVQKYIEKSLNEQKMITFSSKFMNFTIQPLNERKVVFLVKEKKENECTQEEIDKVIFNTQKIKTMGMLTGGIVHNFQNLLSGILGYVTLLKDEFEPKDEKYRKLEFIEIAGFKASRLIKKLLTVSKEFKFEKNPFDINQSIKNVVSIIKYTLDKRIEISLNLKDNLPSALGDEEQIEHVIMNLLINAAQAIPGKGKIKVESGIILPDRNMLKKHPEMKRKQYLYIKVEDNGMGMDKETMKHIFEPFFTTKGEEGTGLGLPIVYKIIKSHDGFIDVESTPGVGSTFTIYIPPTKKKKKEVKTSPEILHKSKCNVLVIDDEEIVCSFMEELLKKLGYKPLVFSNPEEGLKVFKEKKEFIDVVILDLNMPKIHGEEVFHKIKKIKKDVKVIVFTDITLKDRAEKLLKMGAKEFLHKPLTVNELVTKIEKALKE